jgi:hypothetical protein
MELTFYDVAGSAIAYCDDGRLIYSFSGVPLAYLDRDSVYGFDGIHLGWWDHGWVRDHHGAWVFFTESSVGGPPIPAKRAPPARSYKNVPIMPTFKNPRPVPPTGGLGWSSRSGAQFFQRLP